jgi:hypothetical protein
VNRSIPSRSRSRLAGLAALAVAAGALTPLAVGSSSAAAAAAPAAPALLGPLSAGPVVKDVVLDWRSVGEADSYVVELGTDDDWSDDPVHTEKTVATELALPAWLPHASYLWRVAAVDDGVQGAWSRNGTFTRGWRSRPELLSPAVGAAVAGRPTFSWTPVPGASAYQFQVSSSATFSGGSPLDADPANDQASPKVDTCYTTRTELTPFSGRASGQEQAGPCVFSVLGSGSTVYWRVRAIDRYVDKVVEGPDHPGEQRRHLLPAAEHRAQGAGLRLPRREPAPDAGAHGDADDVRGPGSPGPGGLGPGSLGVPRPQRCPDAEGRRRRG